MTSQPHDSSYKLLFSHPAMVEDLLTGFVHEDWVAELDFATLRLENSRDPVEIERAAAGLFHLAAPGVVAGPVAGGAHGCGQRLE